MRYHQYHNDPLGSSQRLTNDQGVLTWSARMEAFGKTTTIDSIITNLINGQSQTVLMPTTTVNNFRFAGQIEDGETGTFYNWNRDYDSAIGRYVQSDPIGFAGGLNRYGYAGARPLSVIDTDGKIAFILVGAAVGGIAGFAGNLITQLVQNQGRIGCVDWSSAGWSAVTGAVGGALLTTGLGVTWLGVTGIGASTNTVNYLLTTDSESWSANGAGVAAGTGAIGGMIGGKVNNPYWFTRPTPQINDAVLTAANITVSTFAKNTIGAGVGAYSPNPNCAP